MHIADISQRSLGYSSGCATTLTPETLLFSPVLSTQDI